MDKNDLKEIMKMHQRVDEFVEQLFLDNGYTIQKETKVGSLRVDFLAEKDDKNYVIEVKRGDLNTSKIYYIGNMLNECTKGTNYIPILVLFSRRSWKEKCTAI